VPLHPARQYWSGAQRTPSHEIPPELDVPALPSSPPPASAAEPTVIMGKGGCAPVRHGRAVVVRGVRGTVGFAVAAASRVDQSGRSRSVNVWLTRWVGLARHRARGERWRS